MKTASTITRVTTLLLLAGACGMATADDNAKTSIFMGRTLDLPKPGVKPNSSGCRGRGLVR